MGKYSNNKFAFADRRKKTQTAYTWKRVQIWDEKNFHCFSDDEKTPFSIIDFRLDERNGTIVFKNVAGVNIREHVLALILLADKDVKKYISKNWEHYNKFGYSISYREGQSGHQYNVATRWTDEYQGHKYQHISRDRFEWQTNSSGKIDYQSSPYYLPVWVLVAYDLGLHKVYVDELVERNHAIAENLTEEERYRYEFESAETFRHRFEKRTKNMLKNTLRKRGVKYKYTPGYRLSCIDYESQKKAGNLLYMCD